MWACLQFNIRGSCGVGCRVLCLRCSFRFVVHVRCSAVCLCIRLSAVASRVGRISRTDMSSALDTVMAVAGKELEKDSSRGCLVIVGLMVVASSRCVCVLERVHEFEWVNGRRQIDKYWHAFKLVEAYLNARTLRTLVDI